MGRSAPRAALQAVLFDMDGLLLDSERLWLDAEIEVMTRLGASWSERDQRALVGGPLERAVAYMLARSAAEVPPAVVGAWLVDGMARRMRGGVPLMPGARELLTELVVAGVPCGLVTSSRRVLMEAALDGIGPRYFSVTVCAEDVTHPKPHPEPYLTAARRLGVDPRHCVVLEDSLTGVTAGEAAGCVTVAVPSVSPIPAVPGRPVVPRLGDLDRERLESLVAHRLAKGGEGGTPPGGPPRGTA